MNISISVIILTRNEEERIEECLKSISWASEIIVVDNGSIDKTVDLAKKYTPHVIYSDSRDFASLRNLGLSRAHGDWVLYLDADEQVTDALREKIIETTKNFTRLSPGGYFIERKNYYLGSLWPTRDKMHRLFWRKALKGWQGELHETAIVDGQIATIEEPLIHMTHRTLEEMVAKTNEWSAVEAKLRFDAGHPAIVPWRLFRVFFTGFANTYFAGGGWKAGVVGIIESLYQGFSLFITYAKLWELQQKDKLLK